MARKVEVVLIDDIDGTTAQRSIAFAIDGQSYEIDLSNENAERFDAALKEFVEAARPVRRKSRGGRAATRAQGPTPAEIRAWAEQSGVKVSARGRIPSEVLEAYEAAH